MVKAVIFDFFGVLVTESWKAFRTTHFSHDPALLEQVTEISNRADAGLISHQEEIRLTAELSGLPAQEVARQISLNTPNQPLLTYIGKLKRHYKIGLLSNASANWLDRMLTPEQLALFDVINLSFEVGFIKPDPRAYGAIAEKLGVEPGECILVDDNQRQCAGGADAGMKTVLYKDFEQAKADLEKLLADTEG